MNRPTGILLLIFILIITAGFTLGLTYAPCYSSLCSEDFFPYATRLHIASYYALLASVVCFLLLRVYNTWLNTLSSTYLTRREVPVLGKRISIGGLALAFWLPTVTLATTGFWVAPELRFWGLRTNPLHWADAQVRLLVTGIIGHHADILLGLVLIPVSRNSILGRVFELRQGTLLYAHKLLAYTFLVAVAAHGIATYTFVGTYAAAKDNSPRKDAFNVDNPTITAKQTEQRGAWHSATLGTGMMSFLFIVAITITALPFLRRTSYNTFYYVHVICSTLIFVSASIHASTDFYFLLPGLILLVLDWCLRLFGGSQGGLGKQVIGTLEDAGGEWYRLSLPVHARTEEPVTDNNAAGNNLEAGEKQRYSRLHPLQTYYLNISSISKLQNHAFTAAKVGTATEGPILLFQRTQATSGKSKQEKLDKEWTWKASNIVSGAQATQPDQADVIAEAPTKLNVRVEGPYIPHEANGFYEADKMVCIVGGTGLTGAYSLALWWLETRSATVSNASFTLVWTIRYRDSAELSEWKALEARASAARNMRTVLHVSSEDGRMDVEGVLREEFAASSPRSGDGVEAKGGEKRSSEGGGKAWVYVSGPAGLLSKAEDACVDIERELRLARRKKSQGVSPLTVDQMEHYVARWEV